MPAHEMSGVLQRHSHRNGDEPARLKALQVARDRAADAVVTEHLVAQAYDQQGRLQSGRAGHQGLQAPDWSAPTGAGTLTGAPAARGGDG